MEKVTFKSSQEFFGKELDNSKNNTVRKIDAKDERFVLLRKFHLGKLKELKIEIVCTEMPEHSFERIVKDVTFWNMLAIVTWYV